MKTIITTFLLCIVVFYSHAQTIVYHENMEVIDSIISNTLTSNGNVAFNADTAFHHDGNQSYYCTFGIGDVATATTDSFDLTGNTFVLLKFWHICKVEFFDQGLVQVSNDGGATWINLTCSQYLGSSNFCSQGNKFTEAAYNTWVPGSPTVPDSTWWKEETFDVSTILGNVTNAMIRFRLADMNNNGMSGRFGWLIDDIRVIAAPCELTPPVITLIPPVLQGTVYDNGPYTYSVTATDNSGIGAVLVSISVNGGAPVNDTMNNPAGNSVYTVTPPDTFAVGDSVCFSYIAYDATNCANSTVSQTFCFKVLQGELLSYCDNFEIANTWIDSLISGSPWQLGTPNYGSTNSAHSAPTAWDISLNSAYLPNTQSYLISPGFDFSNIGNATLKVWMNYNTQNNYDGTRVEYTSDGGVTWATLGTYNDQNGINWYNSSNLNSSGKPGWAGNSSGWKQATRKLIEPAFILNAFPIQFRFVFISNASTQYDGFSIDDFCLTIPAAHEIGVTNVVFPSSLFAIGTIATGKIVVKNFGSQVASNFSINYKYNGVAGVPVNYSGSLIPGASDTIVFAGITIVSGAQPFCGYVSFNADTNQLNDTMCLVLVGVPYASITYCNDFETNPGDWAAVNVTGNSQWESGMPNYGTTNTTHSGLTAWDINLNAGYSGTSTAYLYSPYFDLTTACNARLEFWQNRNTTINYDGARIDFSLNGSTWNTLGVYNDPLATNWYNRSYIYSSNKPAWDATSSGWIKCTYNLNAYSGTPIIQLRYVFTSSSGSGGDGISIDDICIIQPPVDDIAPDAFVSPANNLPAGQNAAVKIKVKNLGCNPATNFDVYYSLNNGSPFGPYTYSGAAINPNSTVTINCDSILVPLGQYNLCAWTSYFPDSINVDDTLCVTLKGLGIDTLNYSNDFEDSSATDFTSVSTSPGTAWEWGAPAYGYTTGAYSGTKAWDINLNTGYGNNAHCELISPYFDLTKAIKVRVYFRQKRNTEPYQDGMHIEYSLNGGNWTLLGYINDPNGIRWYNHIQNWTGTPEWDGLSIGWRRCEYDLNGFDSSGVMRFRFVFTSDGSYTLDGISIDDFYVREAPHHDVGVVSLNNVSMGFPVGTTYTPTVKIKNFGSRTTDSIPVVLVVNGSYVTTQYYPSLLPYDSATVAFAGASYILQAEILNVCVYTDHIKDWVHDNDTMCAEVAGVPLIIPTYTNNFDSINDGWVRTSNDTITKWELGTPNYGVTNSPHSPPNCWDINLNSAYHENANCALYSPLFDFTNVVNAQLSFWLNYNIRPNYDGARLDYSIDSGATYNTLGSASGLGTSNWYDYSSIYSNGKPGWSGSSGGWKLAKDTNLLFLNTITTPVRFRFVFTSYYNSYNYNGFSMDDFSLYCPVVASAGVVNINANSVCVPGIEYISADFRNLGNIPLSNVLITLKIDTTIIVTDTINPIPGGPLNYNQQSSHLFSIPVNLTPGHHNICCYTSFPNGVNDNYPPDDLMCKPIIVLDSTSTFPYCNDFESGTNWLSVNTLNYNIAGSWQLGDPNKTNLNNAYSGINSWVTYLTGNYPNLDNSALLSIIFKVDSGNCYQLSFWHKYFTQASHDGGAVEYSTDCGATWQVFGAVNDPVNWMNSFNVSALNSAGWSGSGITWVQSSHIYSSYQTGTLIFRWRFASDASYTTQGWQIDDVCFEQIASPCYLGLADHHSNEIFLDQNIPNPSSGATEIPFYIPHNGKVILEIRNVLGEIINVPINKLLNEGKHTVTINEGVLPAGVYNYTLKFEQRQLMRTMIIIK
ncbi:MAG: hypothetical protein ABI723_16365 [Bacteroidia bacterium]